MMTFLIKFSVFLILIIIRVSEAIISPCPAFFFVVNDRLYAHTPREQSDTVDYGIYFLTNGTQFAPPFRLPKDTIARIAEVYHCAIFIAIVTDSPSQFDPDIQLWIREECKRLKKEPQDCFRPKFVENKVTSIIPLLSPKEEEEEQHHQTYSPTTRTVVFEGVSCLDRRDQITCHLNSQECNWFDVTLGCRPIAYCDGLLNAEACARRKKYCLWRNLKCQSRSGLN